MSIEMVLKCGAIILIKHCFYCIICVFSVTILMAFLVAKSLTNYERVIDGLGKNRGGYKINQKLKKHSGKIWKDKQKILTKLS